VSIGAPASTSEAVTRRVHRRQPPALAQTDQVDAPSQIVDAHVQLGQVIVDVVILHLQAGAFPVRHQNARQADREQRLHQALAVVIIGDHRRMPGIGRSDQRRRPRGIRASEGAQLHRVQIQQHRIGRCEARLEAVIDFLRLDQELQILAEQLQLRLPHRGYGRHRPEQRDALLQYMFLVQVRLPSRIERRLSRQRSVLACAARSSDLRRSESPTPKRGCQPC
jgi:hypothetical protein